MKIIQKLLPILLVFALSYFAITPFFISGFFPMHDDTQVARVFEMHKSLADGLFPVRWVADLGYHYGYPIFNFYAPLAYYIGALFIFIGFDALVATKMMMALGIVLSGGFMYLFAKEFWGKAGGIISALLYVYAPYHALNVYVRGDVAEFWAYAFVPLVFYGLWKAYKEQQWKYVAIGSIGFAAIILSHNLTAMMVTPFLFLFAFFLFIISFRQKKQFSYYPLAILFIGILLAAFYWFPVFAEMQYTNVLSQIGGGSDYKDHFVCPNQLWDSPWGFGGSTPSCIDGMSYKIGKLHTIFFVLGVICLFIFKKREKIVFQFGILAVLSSLFALFLVISPSKFLWDSIAQMAFFQFPWRFLLVVLFFVSFVGGANVLFVEKFITSKVSLYVSIGLLCGFIIYFNSDVFVAQTILNKTVADYTNPNTLRWTTSKISDEYMPKEFAKPKIPQDVPTSKITVTTENATLLSLKEKTQEIVGEIEAKEATEIIVHQAYFPGWHVSIDGKESEFNIFNKGLKVSVPEGHHTVTIKSSQTLIERVANVVSLTGVLLIIIGIMKRRKVV